MYLHLGNDVVIKESEIIAVYDMDNTTVSKRTREFLTHFEKAGRLIYVTNELPKSFIVCDGGDGGQVVYVSQISTVTLLKRCDFISDNSIYTNTETTQGTQAPQ